jgi:N-acetylneuraminic acid mutarotase
MRCPATRARTGALLAAFLLSTTFIVACLPAHALPANQWAWISGSNTPNAIGVYGTKGTPSTTNVPGGRFGAASWIDSAGNLWLFGGVIASGGGLFRLNDLWEYSPAAGTWTWVSGSNALNPAGIYGTKGTPSTANAPGGRQLAASWTDATGNLWLFGGWGLDSGSGEGPLNDLWEYSPSAGTWTWVSGSDMQSTIGTYGTKGAGSPTNVPGGRTNSAFWKDSAGNLWVFGGHGCDSTQCGLGGNPSLIMSLNDLWKYDPSAATWTWVSGSNVVNASGVFGSRGVPAATNMPGGRGGATAWIDCNNNLWLFGGSDAYVDSAGFFVTDGYQNDLWEYSTSVGVWTWVSGSNTTAPASAVYGTQGIASVSNVPGGRGHAAGWTDLGGNLWLFGGFGLDSAGSTSYLNDLWEYSPSAGTWEWVSGSNTVNAAGAYGIRGTSSASNVPGARSDSTSWTDSAGNFWLFGGDGYAAPGTPIPLFNDLWEYTPATNASSGQSGCPSACKHERGDGETDRDEPRHGHREYGYHEREHHSQDCDDDDDREHEGGRDRR